MNVLVHHYFSVGESLTMVTGRIHGVFDEPFEVGEERLPISVSIGVASTKPNAIQRPIDLIEAADAALYAAKHRGRNTVVEHGFVQMIDEAGMALAG